MKVMASSLIVTAAASCSGSGDPVISSTTCYHGSAGALGLTESIAVKVRDFSNSAGHFDVTGGGIESFSCTNKALKKSGQTIHSDLSDCVPGVITIKSIKYCSDSDEISIAVKAQAVPFATITATLKKVNCGTSQESAMDTMWKSWRQVHSTNGQGNREAFEANVQKIIEGNRENDGWTMAVNKFADLTAEEFSEFQGFKQPERQVQAPSLGVHEYSGRDIPDGVDWSEKGAVTAVKNQGTCGSCWAFSSTGALEGRAKIATGTLVPMSEQQFVDCDKAFVPATNSTDGGCQGGLMDNAFTYGETNDICTEDSYAYKGTQGSCSTSGCTAALKKGSVTGHVDVDATEDALAEAVSAGPVSVAIQANTIFQFYHGGVMGGLCGATLDHGVLVVGYGVDLSPGRGKKYWKVKNSWGSSWGEAGYVRMKKGKGGKGQCGILSGPPSYPVIASSVSV